MTSEAIAHPYALHEAYEVAKATPRFTRKVNPHGAVMDFLWCRWGPASLSYSYVPICASFLPIFASVI